MTNIAASAHSTDSEEKPTATSAANSIKGISLRKNFAWTLAGNLVFGAGQWGMLVVLAKLGSPDIVGRFSLALAICTPVMLLFNLQLRTVQATDARYEYNFGHYFGLRLWTSALAFMVITCFAVLSGYSLNVGLTILAVALAKAFDSLSDVFYGKIQFHERMDRIAMSMMLRGILTLASLTVLFYLTGNLPLALLGMALSGGAVFLKYDIRSALLIFQEKPSLSKEGKTSDLIRPDFSFSRQVSLVWLSMPLGLVSTLVSLNGNMPRYFIQAHLGETELGIFSAMAQFMLVGITVVMALGHSASPRLAKSYASGDGTSFRSLLFKMVTMGAVLGLLGVGIAITAGREILLHLYTPEYAKYPDVFVLLMGAAGIAYVTSFLWYGLTAARFFRVQLPMSALTTGLCAFFCMRLIPGHGLRGAAMALLLSKLFNLCGNAAVVFYAIRVSKKQP